LRSRDESDARRAAGDSSPSSTLRPTDSSRQASTSCGISRTPWSRAIAGDASRTALPSMRVSPVSGCCKPAMIFIIVDLPAPFSPSRAWISPCWTSKPTSSSARTPAKLFVMLATSIAGGIVVMQVLGAE
jgi:hypothetical protein